MLGELSHWRRIDLQRKCCGFARKRRLLRPLAPAWRRPVAWERFLTVITSPIELLNSEELHEQAWQIAFAARLSTHDALYLSLAERWALSYGHWTMCLQSEAPPPIRRFAICAPSFFPIRAAPPTSCGRAPGPRRYL